MAARGKKLLKVRRRAEHKHKIPGIRRDDTVQVIAGNESGKIGKVLRVLQSRERVVVEGANIGYKHVRKSQQNPQGGRIERESPIALSNVLLYCDQCKRGVRHRARIEDGGKKRVCVKCGSALGA